jgi:hypothetical protein
MINMKRPRGNNRPNRPKDVKDLVDVKKFEENLKALRNPPKTRKIFPVDVE